MRFSLVTLLIFSIWCGAALGVWFRREAWVLERFDADRAKLELSIVVVRPPVLSRAPDGIREVGSWLPDSAGSNAFHEPTAILDTRKRTAIYQFRWMQDAFVWCRFERFLTDDSFEVSGVERRSGKYGGGLIRRRFPEWWWGHFYRPEVWAFAFLSGVLAFRGVRVFGCVRRGTTNGFLF